MIFLSRHFQTSVITLGFFLFIATTSFATGHYSIVLEGKNGLVVRIRLGDDGSFRTPNIQVGQYDIRILTDKNDSMLTIELANSNKTPSICDLEYRCSVPGDSIKSSQSQDGITSLSKSWNPGVIVFGNNILSDAEGNAKFVSIAGKVEFRDDKRFVMRTSDWFK